MKADQNTDSANASATTIVLALAFAGGYSDAASYLLAGSFTGHVTGNAVFAAIAIGRGEYRALGVHFAAIAMFLFATCAGLALSRTENKGSRVLALALVVEAILVAIASVGGQAHRPHAGVLIISTLCVALGLQNGVFSKMEGVSLHTTYLTGNVTTFLASLIQQQQPATPPLHNRTTANVLGLTLFGFLVGALAAAIAAPHFGSSALWFLEVPLCLATLSACICKP